MENLYRELHQIMNEYRNNPKYKCANELAVHVPMIGARYGSRKNVRVMWIGRAINGWKGENTFSLPINEFIPNIHCSFANLQRFSWLYDPSSELFYNYHHSAFWRTSKMVCEGLQSSGARIDDWYEDIVWANLYTVAPAGGGNPDGSLCAAQRVICGKLLKKQIEILNPTHIVFVTDWNWFTKFNQPTKYSTPLFPDIEQEKDNPIIVGRGHIGNSTVVVTRRPERHFTDKLFSEHVIKALVDNE